MIHKKRSLLINLALSLFLFILVIYFAYFPIIISPKITNILLFIIIFILACLLTYLSITAGTKGDIYLFLLQSSIFVFIARSVPNMRLSHPPLHDPYYHFVCTLNILRYGTLKPSLGDWYYVGYQLPWPDMHLLTAALVDITNIDVMQFFKFQEPAIGVIFFLSMFLLAKIVTNNDKIAMLSALIASLSDILIFYQSEYHPQGISIVYLILMIYVFFKYKASKNQCFLYISALLIITFIFSHYFTPLFWALIFILYLSILLMIDLLSYRCHNKCALCKIDEESDGFRFDFTFFMPFIILALVYQLVFHTNSIYNLAKISALNEGLMPVMDTMIKLLFVIFLISFLLLMFRSPIIRLLCSAKARLANDFHLATCSILIILVLICGIYVALIPLSISHGSYIFLTSLLRISKYFLFLLAVISILWILRTKNANELRLAIIFSCVFFSGLLGYIVISGFPTDRVIGFLMPFIAIFASLTFFRFWNNGIEDKKIVYTTLIASLIITAGFLNSQTPAYFFKDSGVNTYYWYSNDLSSMESYGITGEWISNYTNVGSRYITEFDTIVIPFFYAERPFDTIAPYLFLEYLKNEDINQFIIINPEINYSFEGDYFDKYEYIKSINILYNNGILLIGVKEHD